MRPSQSFLGEQRFSAFAAARPQSVQMYFASLTKGISVFKSITGTASYRAELVVMWTFVTFVCSHDDFA
jgi:hypothetical protein